MENHTRISLSIHHNGIYGDREKDAVERMQSDDDNDRRQFNGAIVDNSWVCWALDCARTERRAAEQIENDFIAPAILLEHSTEMRNSAPETKKKQRNAHEQQTTQPQDTTSPEY